MALRFDEASLREAVRESLSWTEVCRRLGYAGNNIKTVRKYARGWGISSGHFDRSAAHRRAVGPRYTEKELRSAVSKSISMTETLRRLGYCPTGDNPKTVKKYIRLWGISTDHFDPDRARRELRRSSTSGPIPLEEVLVEGSSYSRGHLKDRLFAAGLKERRCELCCQGEIWNGCRISLVLDHINGISNDNRLENLRIVCPNCAATLDTHCGRKNRLPREERACALCGQMFRAKYSRQRYCSRRCGSRWSRAGDRPGFRGVPNLKLRKVERPPYDQLMREIQAASYLAVGRKYGVSDNAIRKWVRQYERERERERGEGGAGDEPRRQLRLVA
jgi:hypothetical protein